MLSNSIIKGSNDIITRQLKELSVSGNLAPVPLKSVFTKLELHLEDMVFSSEDEEIVFDDNGYIHINIAQSNKLKTVENCPVIILGFNEENRLGVPIIKPTNQKTYAVISVYDKNV